MIELFAEAYRLRLLRSLEEELGPFGYRAIAGVDEAGRGALAGPVVAAAVIPRPGRLVPGVDDSKRLSPDQRERLAPRVREASIAWGVAAVTAGDIDAVNILEATRLAMQRAIAALAPQPDLLLLDALRLPGVSLPQLGVVRGDSVCYSVACASILAKVHRDQIMCNLDLRYPHYGFAAHKGYGAPEHLAALAAYGPSPEHRLTFRSVLPRPREAGGVG
ncbi:MAG TPA: ribonuclease HII [Thermoanaerobaculia bacterium]|nr:ribonuclease HII [Thermoanaerobaculia bacterium]